MYLYEVSLTPIFVWFLLGCIIQPTAAQYSTDDDDLFNRRYSLSQVLVDPFENIIDIGTPFRVITPYYVNNLYTATRVLLTPKTWPSLCGGTVPNATKKEIAIYFKQPSKYDAIYYLLISTHGSNSSKKCSVTEMVKNSLRLSEILSNYGSYISLLIIPDNVQSNKTTSTNEYDLNVAFISSNVSKMIESNIFSYTANTNPYLFSTTVSERPYYMALTEDSNYDGKITVEDYLTHVQQQQFTPPPYFTQPQYGESEKRAPIGGIIAGILVGGIVLYLIVSVKCKRNPPSIVNQPSERMQQPNVIHLQQQQQQQRPWTPGRITPGNEHVAGASTTIATAVNRNALSEAEFASLPQMLYHAKNSTNKGIDDNVFIKSVVPEEYIHDDKNIENVVIDVDQVHRSKFEPSTLQQAAAVDGSICRSLSVFREQYGQSLKAIECCSICLEEFSEDEIVTALPRCCHLFHTTCIGQWILQQKSNNCPLCKCLVIEKS